MSYKSLNIEELYIKSLADKNEILIVGIYFLLLTINGYDYVVMKELNNITRSDNSDIKSKIRLLLFKNNWLKIFEHLYLSIENEFGKKFIVSLKDEFKHTIESSPYFQSRISGRKTKMFSKTTIENANIIH